MRVGVNECLTFLTLLVAGLGLIYQHGQLTVAEKDLNAKIQDISQLAQRLEIESKKRAQTEKRVIDVQRDFVDYSTKLAFIALTLRRFDTLFDQEMNYATALAIQAQMRLPETTREEQ